MGLLASIAAANQLPVWCSCRCHANDGFTVHTRDVAAAALACRWCIDGHCAVLLDLSTSTQIDPLEAQRSLDAAADGC